MQSGIRWPETSKLIAFASALSSIFLSVVVVHCTYRGINCDNVMTITVLAWAETAVSNASYYSKVKNENLPKAVMGLYRELPEELRKQIDINDLMCNMLK